MPLGGNYMGRVVVYLSFGIAAAFSIFNQPAVAGERNVKGVISKVVDGDTLWVTPRGDAETTPTQLADEAKPPKPKTLKIRMISIDTPETHLVTPKGVMGQQPWGDSAAAELAELLPLGKSVTVNDYGTDKYGRTLGRVILGKEDINLAMVKSGWAAPYIICEGPNCSGDFLVELKTEEYLAACDYAKGKGLGIWSPKEKLTEMPFEFRLRAQNRKPDKFVGNYETKEYYAPADYRKVEDCQRVFFMKEADAKKAGFTKAKS